MTEDALTKRFSKLLKGAKDFTLPPPQEKTVFSIGGRGHYENPISDVLAFFFDPEEQHGFSGLFLESFFEAIGDDSVSDFRLVSKPMREVVTDKGNRIDLLLEFHDSVLVIENKIRHWLANDLADYINYANKKYVGKNILLVVLSINTEMSSDKSVINCTYSNFLSVVEPKISGFFMSNPSNKWLVFLRDFILNIRNEIGDKSMSIITIEEQEFFLGNYKEISELLEKRNNFIRRIQDVILVVLKGVCVDTAIHSWSNKITALRFYLDINKDKSNITVAINQNGNFFIRVYFYSVVFGYSLENIKEKFSSVGLCKSWTEQKTIQCFGADKDAELDYKKLISELEMLALILKEILATDK